MTPDPRLLLPATRALLEGWCGPGLLDNEPVLVDGDNGCVIRLDGTPLDYDTSYLPVVFDAYMRSRGTLRLDLSRAECRDRVARVVAAGRWPMQVQRVPAHRAPTPADLLTDPRVRALVEALRFSEGIVANESDTTEIMAALAPFEEVPRG